MGGGGGGSGRRWRPPPTPLLWVASGMLAGQLLVPALPGGGFAFAAATAASFCLTRRGRWSRLLALSLCAAALAHLRLDARLHPTFPADHIARAATGALRLRGCIAGRPERRGRGMRLSLAVDAVRRGRAWRRRQGLVGVTVREATRWWRRGDCVAAVLRLRAPRNFGNPGEFDYRGFLARRGIHATAYAAGDTDWERLPRAFPVPLALRWREQALAILEQVIDADLRPIAAALLFGEGSAIPAAARARYARAGVSHVLAVSGLHVGLVAAAAYALWRWLLARSETLLLRGVVPKLASAASALPVAAYVSLTRGGAATTRAATMGGLLIAAVVLDRPRDWLVGLAVAALLVNLVEPGAVFDASFQLSFVAVVAIVLGGRRLNDWLVASAEDRLLRLRNPRRLRFERWLVLGPGMGLCALLGTAPLSLFHFHQLSIVGVVANPVVVPLLGVGTVGLGLVATLLAPWAPGASACFYAAAALPLSVGDRLVRTLASGRWAAAHPFSPSLPELVLLYAWLAMPLLPRRRRAAAALLASALVAADAGYWYARRFVDTSLRVTFFSVGQGDSALVRFPGGATMLVDAGGLSASFDVGARVVAPQLWREKIHRLDTAVLSHPDFDHYGGMAAILDLFRPPRLWQGGAPGTGKAFAALRSAARRNGVADVLARRGDHVELGGAAVDVLHPGDAGALRSNDRSLTVRIRFGGFSMLLAGDLEAAGEAALLRHGDDLRSTLLKVPHHGSRTSSSAALLAAVQPRVAVVSCGFANRFGMPHPEVVAAYRRRGATLLRTDRDGAVAVRVDRDGAVAVRRGGDGVVWRFRVDARGDVAAPAQRADDLGAAPRG